MKKLLSLSLISAVLCTALITLSACGQDEAPPKEEENPPQEEKAPPKEKEEDSPPEEETPPKEEETPPEEDEAPPEEGTFTKEAKLHYIEPFYRPLDYRPRLCCFMIETEDEELFTTAKPPLTTETPLKAYDFETYEEYNEKYGDKNYVDVRITYRITDKPLPELNDPDNLKEPEVYGLVPCSSCYIRITEGETDEDWDIVGIRKPTAIIEVISIEDI